MVSSSVIVSCKYEIKVLWKTELSAQYLRLLEKHSFLSQFCCAQQHFISLLLWPLEAQSLLITNSGEILELQSSIGSFIAAFKDAAMVKIPHTAFLQHKQPLPQSRAMGCTRFQLQSIVLLKTRATFTVCMARSKQRLKKVRYVSPHLEYKGSTYRRFEVRKDRWWAFPLWLSHLLSSHH